MDAQQRAAELAVAAERIRILREMHDVIAHSLAIMIAQADGGSYVVADTAAARRAFLTIAETGRGRADRHPPHPRHAAPRRQSARSCSPVPDQAPLDELVEQARAAGLQVSLIRVGEPGPLPSGSRLALYRICQEALTNVLKHGGEGVQVDRRAELDRRRRSCSTVTDRGGAGQAGGRPGSRRSRSPGSGLGLIGMRERAEIVGGTLEAGPTEDGFRVRREHPAVRR